MKRKQTPYSEVSTTSVPEPTIVDVPSPLAERLAADSELRHALRRDVAGEIAEQLIRLRQYRELTQQALAEKLGTAQPAIARHESASSNMRCKTLESVLEALDGVIRIDLIPQEHDYLLENFPKWWNVLDTVERSSSATAHYTWTFSRHAHSHRLPQQTTIAESFATPLSGITEMDQRFASWFERL